MYVYHYKDKIAVLANDLATTVSISFLCQFKFVKHFVGVYSTISFHCMNIASKKICDSYATVVAKNVCMCMYVYMYVYVCMYVCMYMYMYVCIYLCM